MGFPFATGLGPTRAFGGFSQQSFGTPGLTGFGFPPPGVDPAFFFQPAASSFNINRLLGAASGQSVPINIGPTPSTLGLPPFLLGFPFFQEDGAPAQNPDPFGGLPGYDPFGPYPTFNPFNPLGNGPSDGGLAASGFNTAGLGGFGMGDPFGAAGLGGAVPGGLPGMGAGGLGGFDLAGLGLPQPKRSRRGGSLESALGGLSTKQLVSLLKELLTMVDGDGGAPDRPQGRRRKPRKY